MSRKEGTKWQREEERGICDDGLSRKKKGDQAASYSRRAVKLTRNPYKDEQSEEGKGGEKPRVGLPNKKTKVMRGQGDGITARYNLSSTKARKRRGGGITPKIRRERPKKNEKDKGWLGMDRIFAEMTRGIKERTRWGRFKLWEKVFKLANDITIADRVEPGREKW